MRRDVPVGSVVVRPFVETQGLTFSYRPLEEQAALVIDGLDLAIEPGTFTCIVGANGSGKSTLSKLLNGILTPSAGSVLVAGMDTVEEALLTEIRRRLGLVFQNPDNQIVSVIVEDDVAFGPENLGIAPEEIRVRVDEALRAVGMYEYRMHAPHLLSGGQKQRVAIAGVIAMRPECIVLDEPTAMLDPEGRAEVLDAVYNLSRGYGITVILITHHMRECILADRVVALDHGKIVLDGPPADVFGEVDRLREIGLTVPDTVALLYALRQSGVDVSLGALTIDDCVDAIRTALG